MSDTPRTDEANEKCGTLNNMDAIEFAIYHGQKLERELAAANERIKKLEQAGDAIADSTEEICYDSYDKKQIANWRKAKEAKNEG